VKPAALHFIRITSGSDAPVYVWAVAMYQMLVTLDAKMRQ
jgi:hypothetical protein